MGWVSHPLTKKETMGVDRPAAPKLPWSFTVTAGTLGKTAVWYFPSPKSLQRCDMLQGCAKTSSNVIQLYTVYNCHLKKKKREDFPSIFHSKPEKKKNSQGQGASSVKTHRVLHWWSSGWSSNLAVQVSRVNGYPGYPIQMHLWMPVWPSLTVGITTKVERP